MWVSFKALDLWINQIRREKLKMGSTCFWVQQHKGASLFFFFLPENLCEELDETNENWKGSFYVKSLADKTNKGATMESLKPAKQRSSSGLHKHHRAIERESRDRQRKYTRVNEMELFWTMIWWYCAL